MTNATTVTEFLLLGFSEIQERQIVHVFTELVIFTVMFYDGYLAICHPLCYAIIMNQGACVKMAATSALHTARTFSFYGPRVVGHFFCDIPQLLTISCSPDLLRQVVPIYINVTFEFCCFIVIVVFYIHTMVMVLRMLSAEGRTKAFSTCLPHLVGITLFVSMGLLAYLKAPSYSPSVMDLLVSMFYTVVSPTVNPLIYSLRNRDMKVQKLQLVHAILFLLVYLAVLTGYLLIFAVMAFNQHIHTPMYFFLRAVHLTAMSFNRYVAICRPLNYVIMDRGTCGKMAAASWLYGSLTAVPPSNSPSTLDLLVSLFYKVVPPALNPFI
ncbi:olfactory receptor 14A16-like [Tachyglossus aculeatus]|uniref:olfactory receptor 14A16-like n=1 Tax=Tachyglossus aculeatus TaxID=9261 RepID=UPI0018F6E3F5|nr:olfactory receptor 14A16-like [Tachyglossus aculeatus]